MDNKKARLDADRTARPRTRLVAHVPEGVCSGPSHTSGHLSYELRTVEDERASLQAQIEAMFLFGAPTKSAIDNAPCCTVCGKRLPPGETEDHATC